MTEFIRFIRRLTCLGRTEHIDSRMRLTLADMPRCETTPLKQVKPLEMDNEKNADKKNRIYRASDRQTTQSISE